MKQLCHVAALLLLLASLPALSGKEGPNEPAKAEDGFVPMFNGKDLAGWVNVNCAPSTFFAKGGEVITTGRPTGYLRTAKQYENFIADFEWLHVNQTEVGNSGFFVWADPLPAVGTPYTRGIEVQVLVNLEKAGYYTSQGDLFSIHGATCQPDRPHPHGWQRCLPSENRCKGGGEWNHYRVIGNNGTLKLHVNGKEVSGLSQCRPRKGYLALESEGAECHFRNLKIKELPSTHPKPDEVAGEAKGFQNLYTGLDLSGWNGDGAARQHWQPHDSVLHYDGKAGETGRALRSEKEYGPCELLVDFRFPAKGGKPCKFGVRIVDKDGLKLSLQPEGQCSVTLTTPRYGLETSRDAGLRPPGQWNRLSVRFKDAGLAVMFNGNDRDAIRIGGKPPGQAKKGVLLLEPAGEMEFANLFVHEDQ